MKKYEVVIREYDTEKILHKHVGTSYIVSTMNLETGQAIANSCTNPIHLTEAIEKLQETLEDAKTKRSGNKEKRKDELRKAVIKAYIKEHGEERTKELEQFLDECEELARDVKDPVEALMMMADLQKRYNREFK